MLLTALLSVASLLVPAAETPTVLLDCAVQDARLTDCRVVTEDQPGTGPQALVLAREVEVDALTLEPGARLQVRIRLRS